LQSVSMAMRSWLFGSGLWIATLVAPLGQQFTSPSDLVNTLYSSYFDGVEIDDFAPYLSVNLTRKMAGRVGMTQFSALGFDPIVADPHGFHNHDADPGSHAWVANRSYRRRGRRQNLVHQRYRGAEPGRDSNAIRKLGSREQKCSKQRVCTCVMTMLAKRRAARRG
jgi:hypothetical protein